MTALPSHGCFWSYPRASDGLQECAFCHATRPVPVKVRGDERTLRFPYIPPGSNAIKRMHVQEVARHRRQIHDDMALLTTSGRLVERARLTLDFRWRTRARRDPGNYVEGAKAIVDALIGRWIIDDDTEHLEMVVRGRVGTGEPDHVLLTLEAIA